MSDERKPTPLPPDSSLTTEEKILNWIESKELQAPAAIFLEMHRPLMPLAWSAAMLAGGFLAPFFGPDYYRKIEALRDPKLMDSMLGKLKKKNEDTRDN